MTKVLAIEIEEFHNCKNKIIKRLKFYGINTFLLVN